MTKNRRERGTRGTSTDSGMGGSVFLTLAVLVAVYWLFAWVTEPNLPETVLQQVEEIDRIEESLERLISFLDEHRTTLKRQEANLARLRSEHESLRPLVEADRELVAAVLAEEGKRQRRYVWLDRFVAFVLGIGSSYVGGLILRVRRRRRVSLSTGDQASPDE